VLKESRWSHLEANASQLEIGTFIGDATTAIWRDVPSRKKRSAQRLELSCTRGGIPANTSISAIYVTAGDRTRTGEVLLGNPFQNSYQVH